MKKILAIVLAVVMLLPVFAVNAFAADEPMNLVVTSGRVTLKLADVVKAGESVEIHLAGTTDGAFRFCLSDGASKGANWNQSNIPLIMASNDKIKDGAFDVTETLTATADSQYLLISDGSHHFKGEATFKNLVIETIECNGTAVDLSTLNTNWGSGKVEAPKEEVAEDKVIDIAIPEDIVNEDGTINSWTEIVKGDAAATVVDAMSSNENAYFEMSYSTIDEGWGYQLIFETKSVTEYLTVDGTKQVLRLTRDDIINKVKAIENIVFIRSNYGVSSVKYHSIKVVKGDEVLVELGERAPGSWTAIAEGDELKQLKDALAEEGTELVVEYTASGEGWGAQFIMETSGKSVGLEKNVTDKVLRLTAGEFAANCGGDISMLNLMRFNGGSPITINSIKVIIPAPEEEEVLSNSFAFVYINEEYHAYSFRELFIPMPHTDNGFGYCRFCREEMAVTDVGGDQSILVLEKTGGQDFETDAKIADGIVLVDNTENNGNCRIATNWKSNGTAWNTLTKAIPTEGAWLKVTYTGKLNSIIFQTENTSAPEAFETTAPAVVEEGEQNVAWFNCADIVANSPVGLSGDFGGWANCMLNYEGETTVYGIEVVIPEVVPVAE